MKKRVAVLLALAGFVCSAAAQSGGGLLSSDNSSAVKQAEQKHFLECLARVYDPAFWISYNGALYFAPRTDAQERELRAMKQARARYVAFTNRHERFELTARALGKSGLPEPWRLKLLLPYSETQPNLTPTLNRAVRVLPAYTLLGKLPDGDAVLLGGGTTNFVMDFGRSLEDNSRTNAILIKEGEKTYHTSAGERRTIEAFTDAGLSAEEVAILRQASGAFQKAAAALTVAVANDHAAEDFESYRMRASDSSPYLEYMLARCYLEGIGTAKDAELGRQWMLRAARSGSGDAKAYLERTASTGR